MFKLFRGIGLLATGLLLSLGTATAQPYTLKIGSGTVNDTSQEWLRLFKAGVEQRSGGKIKVETYLAGEFANSAVLARLKILTRGRYLWTRTIGSTFVGEGLDSAVFITIAFFGIMPHGELLPAIATQWVFKTAYETLATPFTYLVVNFLKRVEGVDVYDHATPLNPFVVSES